MRAGRLRHRVAIQANTPAKSGGYGGEGDSWATIATVWAGIESEGSKEYSDGQTTKAAATFTVTIRYRAGITEQHRLLFGSRVLEITGRPENKDERNIELRIPCREVTS